MENKKNKLRQELRKMILIQIDDIDNFPTPETWTDNLLVALMVIIKEECNGE